MREIINHIKKRGFKDIFNWKKLLVFFKSKKELCTGINIEPSEALAYSEQLFYRSLLCSQCVKEGICKEEEYDINRRCEFVLLN